MPRLATAFTTLVLLLAAVPGRAAFHAALIDEVMSGANGDPSVQYVEIRMLAGFQTFVANTRLTAFDCAGTPTVLIDDLPGNVPNGGNGVRWIMASPGAGAFMAASGISPDFFWDDAATGSIPTACGQVCWGAPDGTGFPPDPPTWNAADPANYIDCVAYGPYTGPRPTAAAPATATPGNGTLSLTRTGNGANTNAFALACPTPANNASAMGGFGSCTAPASTTTTTTTPPAGGTTTSTAPPGAAARRLTGQGLLLKANPAKPARRLLTVSSNDGTAIFAAPAVEAAVAAGGASLRVVTAAGDAFDDTYALPAANWRCSSRRCRYRDPARAAGPIVRIVLTGRTSLRVRGQGAGLGHTLAVDPTPVGVVLTLGTERFCMRFDGAPSFRADRRYRAGDAGTATPCP